MTNGFDSAPTRMGIRIAATATYLPGEPVVSTDIDRRAGLSAGTCERRLGIRRRHYAGGETTSAMAAKAARRALEAAGWRAADLDLVVSASAVMEQWIPTQAVLLQHALGLGAAATPVLDINATCLSFLAALDQVSYAMAMGRYRRVLIATAEVPSRALDWSDIDICGNFGDGAAAVLLERDPRSDAGIVTARFETYSDGARLCELRAGGSLIDLHGDMDAVRAGAIFRMDGPAAYRLSARHFPSFLRRLLNEAGLSVDDLAAVVPHQASASALHHLRRLSRVPAAKVVDIFADHGNQVAASLPIALDHALRSGRLGRGDTALLVGTAAGITLGGLVLRV
ncbi:MAG TPA: 3-oxoacyl-[acyl-carrier-protein] synthase III C-terminal domain-containing protein [Magnetospirillum sp.]|nr:3-oxoacyl-[acyl-carrier-protein] synthase III C-terminal domain-containing protein [Magnetospirillum sp.]